MSTEDIRGVEGGRNESPPVQRGLLDHLLVDLGVTGKNVDYTNGGVVRVPIHTHAVEHEVPEDLIASVHCG